MDFVEVRQGYMVKNKQSPRQVAMPTSADILAVLERRRVAWDGRSSELLEPGGHDGVIVRGQGKAMRVLHKAVHFLRALRHLGRIDNRSRETAELTAALDQRLGETSLGLKELRDRLDNTEREFRDRLDITARELRDRSSRIEDWFVELRERLAVVEHISRVKSGAFQASQADPRFPLNWQVATPAEVRLVFETLLGRAPEDNQIGMDSGALDFILSVATSEERRARLAAEFHESEMKAADYWVAKTHNGLMLTSTHDRVIGESLRLYGRFQEADVEEAVTLLKTIDVVVERSIFLDIGANIGTHSLYALNHGFERAICIEPDHDNFRLLRVNQILNNLDRCCLNLLVAVSDHDGTASLELSPLNFGDHRVRLVETQSSALHGEPQWTTHPIETRRLDCILREADVDPRSIGLTWIDTQGHEGHVLSGAPSLLASSGPIVAEFWPYGLARVDGYGRLREVLSTSGRRVFDLRKSIRCQDLKPLALTELDAIYEEFLAGESEATSPDTDLLLV